MASNNVLVLGPPHSGKIRVAQHITKDLDTSTIQAKSHSGLIYSFRLVTKYYCSRVNLLVEEFPDSRNSPDSTVASLEAFCKEFGSSEFSELRDELDGLVFTLDVSKQSEAMSLVDLYLKLKDMFEDDGVFMAVVAFGNASQQNLDDLEDKVAARGVEFINFIEQGTNEYSEKVGRDRLMEIFEAHEWSHMEPRTKSNETVLHGSQELVAAPEVVLSKNDIDDEGERTSRADLDTLFAKLKVDKLRAEGMSEKDKKTFVDELVEDYMEYF
ncbi:hypothetical protein OXX80_000621 [Metschnikowia pulcherrima]